MDRSIEKSVALTYEVSMKTVRFAVMGASSSALSLPFSPVSSTARIVSTALDGSLTRWLGAIAASSDTKNVGHRGGLPSVRSKMSTGKAALSPPSTISESWPLRCECSLNGR